MYTAKLAAAKAAAWMTHYKMHQRLNGVLNYYNIYMFTANN